MTKGSLSFTKARDMLLEKIKPLYKEEIPLDKASGRVLGIDILAEDNIPSFDKSPLDGYAFRGEDTRLASKDNPITLRILEEVPAGAFPTQSVNSGEAIKILTGAPIPLGANAVAPYEITEFDNNHVKLFREFKPSENIIYKGEDAKIGSVLALEGMKIDEATSGLLSVLGRANPKVYKKPLVGVISTGRELVEPSQTPTGGQIRNSNGNMLITALKRLGFDTLYLGIVGDKTESIAESFKIGLEKCDAVISTGGVSAGDYDLTPKAMELSGVDIIIRGVKLKPGMACAYGFKGEKPVFGLSGNPISSLTNFYAIVLPCLRKLSGEREYISPLFDVVLKEDFEKPSKNGRLLRGRLVIENGVASMTFSKSQGNIVLSSTVGANMMAIIPDESGPVKKGSVLKGFMI